MNFVAVPGEEEFRAVSNGVKLFYLSVPQTAPEMVPPFWGGKSGFHATPRMALTWNWDGYALTGSKHKKYLLQKRLHGSTLTTLIITPVLSLILFLHFFYRANGLMVHFMICQRYLWQGWGVLLRWLTSLLWALPACSSLLFSVRCMLNIHLRFSSVHLQISDSCDSWQRL